MYVLNFSDGSLGTLEILTRIFKCLSMRILVYHTDKYKQHNVVDNNLVSHVWYNPPVRLILKIDLDGNHDGRKDRICIMFPHGKATFFLHQNNWLRLRGLMEQES